jgi:hypothetical protein
MRLMCGNSSGKAQLYISGIARPRERKLSESYLQIGKESEYVSTCELYLNCQSLYLSISSLLPWLRTIGGHLIGPPLLTGKNALGNRLNSNRLLLTNWPICRFMDRGWSDGQTTADWPGQLICLCAEYFNPGCLFGTEIPFKELK